MEQPADAARNSAAALAVRDERLAEADQALAAVLAQAHATATGALQRLAAIEDDIEAAVQNQDSLALDTSAGSLSFQKYLLAKLEEIRTIVAEAHTEDIAAAARLNSLISQYFSLNGR